MTKMTLILSTLLFLAACSPADVVGGNELGGIIDSNNNEIRGVFRAAEDHCARYGKKVGRVYHSAWSRIVTFECRTVP